MEITGADSLFEAWHGPSESNGFFVYEVKLNKDHPILKGHFPGMPVVPGVMQLFLVRRCAEKVLKKTLRWSLQEKAKFFTPWTPDSGPEAEVRLKFRPEDTAASWHVEARIAHGEVLFLSVKGRLETC